MKKITLILICACFAFVSNAQYFQGTISKSGNDLIFLIKPNVGGGNITTTWSDVEFFVRWPDGSPPFTFGAITINTTDFPSVSIPNNGANAQGSEIGYTNQWFGTSFSATPSATYVDGQEYEVFRVTLDVPASTINFEVVHNSGFFPTYLALTGGAGNDLTGAGSGQINYYSVNAMSCTTCPASTAGTNDVDPGAVVVPVELATFEAFKQNRTEGRLEWVTESEFNTSHFEIERSENSRDWNYVGKETAEGFYSETKKYTHIDKQASYNTNAQGNVFYRLKIIDFDGTYEYSDVKSLNYMDQEGRDELTAFPNPTRDYTTVSGLTTNAEYTLYAKNGSIAKTGVFLPGDNKLEINEFAAGVYYIDVKLQSGNQRLPIVVIR